MNLVTAEVFVFDNSDKHLLIVGVVLLAFIAGVILGVTGTERRFRSGELRVENGVIVPVPRGDR